MRTVDDFRRLRLRVETTIVALTEIDVPKEIPPEDEIVYVKGQAGMSGQHCDLRVDVPGFAPTGVRVVSQTVEVV